MVSAVVRWLRENVSARVILTILRIWIGWQWLVASLEKLGSPAWTGAQSGSAITGFLQHAVTLSTGNHPSVQGWYASFISGVALPSAGFLTYLVPIGEILIGIALISGTVTTFAALMGAFMNTAFLLAGTTSTNPIMLIAEVFILVAGFNAAMYGIDYWFIPWFRKAWKHEVAVGAKPKQRV